jgi:hypothetical protein
MPPAADTDGVDELIRVWSAYLGEITSCRAVCLRHVSTAAVRERGSTLRLRESFRPPEQIVDRLRTRVERLESWSRSPYWPSERRKWAAILGKATPHLRRSDGFAIARGGEWEGRAILIHARTQGSELVVELAVPTVPSPLPELPLRIVAHALRCLEHLLPDIPALPLRPDRGDSTIGAYLARATPEHLIAGKLFSAARAGT